MQPLFHFKIGSVQFDHKKRRGRSRWTRWTLNDFSCVSETIGYFKKKKKNFFIRLILLPLENRKAYPSRFQDNGALHGRDFVSSVHLTSQRH